MSRIVPWMCREEWLTTYRNLYNFEDTELQAQGMKRVQAWKSRSSGKLPLSIEVTASLIAAITSDVEESKKSPLTVRLAMAMTIVRFVNGMVDMEQRGVYARSVQSIADDIGLPDWLVDLRHESTHAALPSLEVLRVGCRFSLSWLNSNYWQSQIAEFEEHSKKFVNLVQSYINDIGGDLLLGEEKKSKKKKNLDLIKEIVHLTAQHNMWDSVSDILVGELGLLIPSTATLEKFVINWPDITEQSTRDILMGLPKEAFSIWGPLFKAWHKENHMFLSKLIATLIQKVHKLEMCSENLVLVRYIACWVHFILLNSCSVNNEAKQWKIKAELDYSSVLEVCLRNCSSYTPVFLSLIINNFEHLPDKLNHKLKELSSFIIAPLAFYTITSDDDGSVMEEHTGKDTVYDNLAKHYPSLADCVKSKLERSIQSNNSDWELCDSAYTSSVPVGGLLGCEPMEYKLLELPEECDSMQVEARSSNVESSSGFETDTCKLSGDNCDIEDELLDESSSPEMQCQASDTVKEFSSSVIESISQQIWIF